VSGESTRLKCEVPYASSLKPTLTWTRDGEVVQSLDESGLGKEFALLSVRSVSLDPVGPDDDKAEYRCDMKVADVVVEDRCNIILDVACKSYCTPYPD